MFAFSDNINQTLLDIWINILWIYTELLGFLHRLTLNVTLNTFFFLFLKDARREGEWCSLPCLWQIRQDHEWAALWQERERITTPGISTAFKKCSKYLCSVIFWINEFVKGTNFNTWKKAEKQHFPHHYLGTSGLHAEESHRIQCCLCFLWHFPFLLLRHGCMCHHRPPGQLFLEQGHWCSRPCSQQARSLAIRLLKHSEELL